MKANTLRLAIIFFLYFTGNGFAAASIHASVDKTGIAANELLTYKLTLSSTDKNIPAPHMPDFKGFVVVSQAQSSTVSFQKSGPRSVLVFVFILLPQATGKLAIGPAQVTVQGNTVSSEEFQIEVKPARSRNIEPPQHDVPVPEQSLPEQAPDQEEPGADQPKYTL